MSYFLSSPQYNIPNDGRTFVRSFRAVDIHPPLKALHASLTYTVYLKCEAYHFLFYFLSFKRPLYKKIMGRVYHYNTYKDKIYFMTMTLVE